VDLDGNPFTPNPTIANEFNNVPLRSNLKGTISMFHDPSIQNSAASNQFFLNLIDNSQLLDGSTGQAVFGNVVGDGMSLIDVYANQLPLINMNPDSDGNGVRDTGLPFGTLPVIVNQSQGTFLPLILASAKSVDYFGSNITTDVKAGGLTFANNDAFIDTGATFTGTGALTVGVGRTLGVREGYVINRSIVNHGTLAPGLSLGVIGIDSTYFQFSDGTLAIQLAGTTADTQYDRLITSSTAYLAGRLQVSFLNNFSPVVGNSFTVLTAQSILGNFTSFDLPQLSTGLLWNIGQSSTAVTLTVVTDAGDLNKDGVVDARDYTFWRKANGTATNYQLWRSNFGNRSGGVFGAGADAGGLTNGNVPEPSSGFLVLMAGLLVVALPGRRWAFGKAK
jgi:cyclophilin family peptidyl-prolyl cis-trans isomerase